MGALSSCLKSKTLYRQGSTNFIVGTASMQGLRLTQEDAHKIMFAMPNHPDTAFFGVFDGHGGEKTSLFLAEKVVPAIDALDSFSDENIIECLLKLDKQFVSDQNASIREQGSTCVFCLVKLETSNSSEKIYNVICANIGDSRCLKISPDGKWEPLSFDHKPCNDNELKRIKEAGGYVISNRVDGSLAVSRAFGDYNLKSDHKLEQVKQKVTAEAQIVRSRLRAEDLLLVCCDGIFENLSNEQVAKFVAEHYHQHTDPAKTLSKLFDAAEMSGSSDNMTGVLVHFADGSAVPCAQQYVPGPFFVGKDDKVFVDAFLADAVRSNVAMAPRVYLAAYHQDLLGSLVKPAGDRVKKDDVLKEIAAHEPWKCSIEDLAFIINSLNASVVVDEAVLALLRENGVLTLADLKECADSGAIDKIGLVELVVKNVRVIFSLWSQLPPVESSANGN